MTQHTGAESAVSPTTTFDIEMLERIEQTYASIRDIAGSVVSIQNTNENTNQKVTVIGRALLAQQHELQQLQQRYVAHSDDAMQMYQTTREHQLAVATGVDGVLAATKQIDVINENQVQATKHLRDIEAQQSTFVREQAQRLGDNATQLADIHASILEIKGLVDNIEIEEQVHFVNAKVSEIENRVAACLDIRTELQSEMYAHMSRLMNDMKVFYEKQKQQAAAIDNLEAMVTSYGNLALDIDRKLDNIMVQLRVKQVAPPMTLEEMFPLPQPTKSEVIEPPKKAGLFKRVFKG